MESDPHPEDGDGIHARLARHRQGRNISDSAVWPIATRDSDCRTQSIARSGHLQTLQFDAQFA
jgi:hypothetical protein